MVLIALYNPGKKGVVQMNYTLLIFYAGID